MAVETLDGNVKLTDEDVFSKIRINPTPSKYRRGAEGRIGTDYYIGSYNGIGFNCEPEFRDAWVAGDIAEVNLKAGKYKRLMAQVDPMNPRDPNDTTEPEMELIERDSWTLTGFTSYTQLSKMKLAKARVNIGIKREELAYIVEEAKAMRELKIDEKTMSELKDVI